MKRVWDEDDESISVAVLVARKAALKAAVDLDIANGYVTHLPRILHRAQEIETWLLREVDS